MFAIFFGLLTFHSFLSLVYPIIFSPIMHQSQPPVAFLLLSFNWLSINLWLGPTWHLLGHQNQRVEWNQSFQFDFHISSYPLCSHINRVSIFQILKQVLRLLSLLWSGSKLWPHITLIQSWEWNSLFHECLAPIYIWYSSQ